MKKKKYISINSKSIKLSSYNYADELSKIELEHFPIIDDFTIELHETGKLGLHACFTKNEGILSGFPWWDHIEKDLEKMTLDNIPLGTIYTPFDDLEQGWQILIFRKGKFVYILEGDEPCTTEFSTWYRVSIDLYINEWKRIINDFT